MEIFTNTDRTYATYARAKKRALALEERHLAINGEVIGAPPRFVIATNEAGRFYPVFIGLSTVDLIHAGACVAN